MPTAYARGEAAQPDVPAAGGGGRPYLPPQNYANERDNALFGPTGRPDEHPATGAGLTGRIPPDQSVFAALDVIREAADQPGSPQALRSLAAHLTYLLGGS